MRPVIALVLALGAAGLISMGGADLTAADPPKTKAQLKKEMRLKKLAEKKARLAAELDSKPIEPPVQRSTPPARPVKLVDASQISQLIDRHVNAKLQAEEVTPSPRSTDAEFLRRVSLDIAGVIPTAEEARRFLDDRDPAKRARLVEQLLANPAYGKHQSDLWQAMLLPRDSNNRFILREPFINWLTESFNSNLPWNQFVYDLVSASGTVAENPAVTFFLANRSVDKLTDQVSQQFMGLQLSCAQCHNHPFTTWKQTEYWGMAAFFSKVQPQNPKNMNKGGDNTKIGVSEGRGRTRLRDFFPESEKTVPAKFFGDIEPKLSPSEPYRPHLAKWLTAPENPFFARAMVNRTWGQFFGRGLVHPIDDMHEDNPGTHPELLDELSKTFAYGGFDLKHLIRGIVLSESYQRTSKPHAGNEKAEGVIARMNMKTMTAEQLYDSLMQITGPMAPMPREQRAGGNRNAPGPRDRFVQFYLAGAEKPNPAEYEAGIPQALKLMNSRMVGNPAALRGIITPGTPPAQGIEQIFLTALARRPTTDEITRLSAYLREANSPVEGYGDILWAVLNSSEFVMVR